MPIPREVLLDVGLVCDVRGDLLENDEVEREAQTHVPHELEVVDHAVARDVRLPIRSIGFLMSGSACCVMGCCFLAEILPLGANTPPHHLSDPEPSPAMLVVSGVPAVGSMMSTDAD